MSDIDVNENELYILNKELLKCLLVDRSSGKNIIWATDNYSRNPEKGYQREDQIQIERVIGRYHKRIKPRIRKSKAEQKRRSKDMAEVFTPAWMCNKQNNLIDNAWFGYESAFNIETDSGWESTKVVDFKDKKWQDYVDLERMEITCGEAPYLTSRYDVVTGNYIEPMNRIGLLDRKMRVISENVDTEEEWLKYAEIAYKRTYGYEFQGDNLLIARENLLFTFRDFYKLKFNQEPTAEILLPIAKIISWNIWQMDGLKYVIPFSCHTEKPRQMRLGFEEDAEEEEELCPGCLSGNPTRHNGTKCKIKDWRKNKTVLFVELVK